MQSLSWQAMVPQKGRDKKDEDQRKRSWALWLKGQI